MSENCFISCDWGCSNLRVALVNLNSAEVFSEVRGERGIIELSKEPSCSPELYKRELLSCVKKLDFSAVSDQEKLPIVLSGMIVSNIGWKNLDYAKAPLLLDGKTFNFEEDKIDSHPGFFISGACTEGDVMRGEETQILGLLNESELESFKKKSCIILPGTHSKHVIIENNSLISITSYMTGELFALLSQHSVLQHSVIQEHDKQVDLATKHADVYKSAVQEGSENPLTSVLFKVRVNQIFNRYSEEENSAYLTGLLLGTELANLKSKYSEYSILIAAPASLHRYYELASEALDLNVEFVPVSILEQAAIKGQIKFLEGRI